MCNFYIPDVFNVLIQCMTKWLLFRLHNSLSLGQIDAFKLTSCIHLSLPMQCSYFSPSNLFASLHITMEAEQEDIEIPPMCEQMSSVRSYPSTCFLIVY